jgi:hypothetical protein
MAPGTRFPIRIDWPFRPWLLVFGVLGRRNADVRLGGGRLFARFGFFSLDLALAAIARGEQQGPWRWWTAVGVRGTLGRPEITFGGSAHGGVALLLARPVARWSWVRNLREVYFSLDHPQRFVAELERQLAEDRASSAAAPAG